MSNNRNKKLIHFVVAFVVLSVAIFLLGLKINPKDITNLLEKAGIWAPLAFILVCTLPYIIAPLSGTPFYFAGYYLFGSRVQIYTYLSGLIGATACFLISRKWGRPLVLRLVGKESMEKVDRFSKNYGIKSLVLLRFFQGHLNDFVSYAYGLTEMRFTHFIFISAIVPIPWILLWQFLIFPKIGGFGEFTIFYLLGVLPFLVISLFLFGRFRKKA